MTSHKVGIPATMQAKIENLSTETPSSSQQQQQQPSSKPSTSSSTSSSRPIHPAVVTNFGPGKGGGCAEFSTWAYLTRPRPGCRSSSSRSSSSSNNNKDHPLPNLVTAHSNALRVYTILPYGGTLALTAVYDNLAGTICSLDVIPGGMGGGDMCRCGALTGRDEMEKDWEEEEDGESGNGCTCSYDGLLIGFAGHPRLSLVYPSTPMVGGGYWRKDDMETKEMKAAEATNNDTSQEEDSESDHHYGVGQGGVLLASSIIDLTSALTERSMGGTSFLEQDIIVSVSTTSTIANGVDIIKSTTKSGYSNIDDDDPSVSVVLGGGVAIASFSLPKASRPEDGSSSSSSNPSWWRIASEPYILPLTYLASKIRSDFGGTNLSSSSSSAVPSILTKGKNQPTVVGHTGSVGHGFGDIVDIAFLSGYTEPTLLVLHSNPKRGGGRQWMGRMGRTEEIPVVGRENVIKGNDDQDDDDMETEEDKPAPETMATGTKFGLTLTAVSLAIHQHRSVVLWSLTDAIPADAWKLVPHPTNGVIVMGVNTIVYVGMGGKIQSALAANGFAKVGCPIGLIPPSQSSTMAKNMNAVHIEANPAPLPLLSLQLDGARVAFVSENVALVCLGSGALHSLQLHSDGAGKFMSLSPCGHRVGGLGVASCLSALAMGYHAKSFDRYLKNSTTDKNAARTMKKEGGVDENALSGPNIATKGVLFVGSRMGDCTLLAFAINEPTRLIVTDVDAVENENFKRKLDPDEASSMSRHTKKQIKTDVSETAEIVEEENGEKALTEDDILRLEEDELYRDDTVGVDTTAPSLVSPSRTDNDSESDDVLPNRSAARKSVRFLTTFRTITAIDSLTGLGPLGPGCCGPVATFPHSTEQDDAAAVPSSESSPFSNTFASSARHMIIPCGFGDSGGLAVLTTPGRDTVGGTILVEADLLGMEGTIFSLPQSNLVLLPKADGAGAMVLRGVLGMSDQAGFQPAEEFEEVDAKALAQNANCEQDSMNVDSAPSIHNVEDVIGRMTLYAVSEFGKGSPYCVFLVKSPQSGVPYSIVIIKAESEVERKGNSDIKLSVAHVHEMASHAMLDEDNGRSLVSVTPMVSEASRDGNSFSITFGCVWSCGHSSIFSVNTKTASGEMEFEVSETVFVGDSQEGHFYQSDKIVAMDLVSLPGHIFACDEFKSAPIPLIGDSESLSFPPDRLSMHGSWIMGSNKNPRSNIDQTLIIICRRSGSLEVYNKNDAIKLSQIENNDGNIVPIWSAVGCSHGASVLGQSEGRSKARKPEGHDVETSEIRFFVSGPSLCEDLSDSPVGRDTWMLRSLCILVDTSLGDLHLYSGSKSNGNRLEFSRVPLSCVSRPSDEAGRHLIKLRRKGIVPDAKHSGFRANRLHRFIDISRQDGLFAATPRPLWFVSERGAPAVVSHKSRHVSAAGARQAPVSGFCSVMPSIFQNANKGFISLHDRIGRVGSQRLTLFNGLWDVFAPRGLLPGGGYCINKHPMGVTVRQIEFIDDASISSTSRPIYAMLVSREVETKQDELNDDGMTPEERQQIKAEKEAAQIRKQVEADLGGFEIDQEWVEGQIEREETFEVDKTLGLAPPMITCKFEVWIVDASSDWAVLDKYELDDDEHGTALKVMYLTDVIEDSDETPRKSLFIVVGTGIIEYDGEDLASKGKLLLFQAKKVKKSTAVLNPPLELVKRVEKEIAIGPVTYLASLHSEDIFRLVVGAGSEVTVEQYGSHKLTQVGFYHAHMQVLQITIFKTFFLLSDAYDSIHFLVWRESDKSLTLLAKDYEPCEVFAAGLISRGGAMSFVCHDDRENLQFLQYAPGDNEARGGNKLVCRADYHLGFQTTSFQSHWARSSLLFNSCTISSTLASLKQQDSLFGRLDDDQRFAVNFGTTDSSFCSIIPLSEPTYWRLAALQSVMSNALESNCALSHRSWRLYRRSTRRGGSKNVERKKGVIDADLVSKFVDLPLPEQEDLASSIGSTVALIMDNLLELGCAAQPI